MSLADSGANDAADDIADATAKLAAWCRARDFAGYDPYDALNSRLFRATPFYHSRLARLAWTQAFKRSLIDFRKLALVPAGHNSKGLALFALAALARFRRTQEQDAEREVRRLLESLIATRIDEEGSAWTAWGYNFDWQGRAFFAPRCTPTIVPTAFAVRALLEGWRAFEDESYLRLARRAAEFVMRCLPRPIDTADEICFAYSPLDRTRVFNASLLAAELLAGVSSEIDDGEEKREMCDTAMRVARYVCRRQHADGSWAYGADSYQTWADNFHTAFLLSSLIRIKRCAERLGVETHELDASLRSGYDFWIANFFGADGFPKYYPERAHPADAHSAGAALATLSEMTDARSIPLATRVARWTLAEMRAADGSFYYQRHHHYTNRIRYMRWSQAWMLYGLERLLERRASDK